MEISELKTEQLKTIQKEREKKTEKKNEQNITEELHVKKQ